MPKFMMDIGLDRILFLLLYLSIAFFAVKGDNLIDKCYFIALTIYLIRMLIYFYKKRKQCTS